MNEERLNYLKEEVREETYRQWRNLTDKTIDQIVEETTKRILKDYDVSNLSDRDFDRFIDSGCIEYVVELVGVDLL